MKHPDKKIKRLRQATQADTDLQAIELLIWNLKISGKFKGQARKDVEVRIRVIRDYLEEKVREFKNLKVGV